VVLAGAGAASAFGASAAADIHERMVLGRVAHGAGSASAAAVERADDIRVVLTYVAFGSLVAVVGALAAWCYELTRNFGVLGVRGARFSAAWAAGGWFVPVLNLWRPKQVVDDLWRSGAPEGPAGGNWRLRPVAPLIHVWWALWIASLVIGRLAGRGPVIDVGELRASLALHAVTKVGSVSAVILGAAAVVAITARQRRLAATHGLTAPTTRPGPSRALAIVPGVLGVVAFAATLAVLAASTDGATAATSAVSVWDLEIADCFDSAAMSGAADVELAFVDVADCDDPHEFQVIDELAYPADRDARYPGDALEDFALDRCVAGFDKAVGTPFMESSLDVVTMWPSAESWKGGDRTIACIAVRVDGDVLIGDVLGSGM
jgi:hypothetical protein